MTYIVIKKEKLELALKALTPFANDAIEIHPNWSNERVRASLTQKKPLTVGDFRKAKDARITLTEALAQRDKTYVHDAETELNCAEEILDAYDAEFGLEHNGYDCIGDYIKAVVEAARKLSPQKPDAGINGLTEAETNATASVIGLINAAPQTEQEDLTCDICGQTTLDPWHFSTASSRHNHACDKCWQNNSSKQEVQKLLVRDLAKILGVNVSYVCEALMVSSKPPHSTNMYVSPDDTVEVTNLNI